ncbi:acylphosphatase [Niabella sp. W65]|jgi:acylphosphatase|nr:acylphosphatase [Niabella sp. W65]MCH7363263.1 acylphosphatase [Niabella sp. W65]ULT39191.1 acylphosphatase [Niabella sp. I65]
MVTKNIIVKGKVQGVFFRQSTQRKAEELGINGSVENLTDGYTVSILATGEEHQLAEFISWCQQGPPRAEVQQLEISDMPLQKFEKFSIL